MLLHTDMISAGELMATPRSKLRAELRRSMDVHMKGE